MSQKQHILSRIYVGKPTYTCSALNIYVAYRTYIKQNVCCYECIYVFKILGKLHISIFIYVVIAAYMLSPQSIYVVKNNIYQTTYIPLKK